MLSVSVGSACQISSVINGINGCRSFTVLEIRKTRTLCAYTAVSPPDCKRDFVSSIYQSHSTSQTKSYIFCSARPSSNLSRFSVTSFTKRLYCESTHLSSIAKVSGSVQSATSSERFSRTKRVAFQSLFAKFRAALIFSSEKRMSLPGLLPVTSASRSASAPYWSITSSGSMPLPSDLDIFRPWASRTRPWINTVRNGTFPVCSMAEKIMRATQKKMISYPVTSVSVG